MKAIRTRYLGPTNRRGSRIKADDGEGHSVTLSRDCSLNTDENHRLAAAALCGKMGWPGNLETGWHGNAAYHVFVE